MRPTNCAFRSLEGKASIVDPVNKLYSLAYKVQQTFSVPAKKKMNQVNNMKHACYFRVIIVFETYFIYISKDA